MPYNCVSYNFNISSLSTILFVACSLDLLPLNLNKKTAIFTIHFQFTGEYNKVWMFRAEQKTKLGSDTTCIRFWYKWQFEF